MTDMGNNESTYVGPVARLWRDRSTWTLVLTCLFVAIVGTVRRNDISGMEPEAFWAMKSEWMDQADIVVLGDSRTLVDVSPETMRDALPNARILNYAFSAVSYTEPYFKMVEELLDKTSEQPTVALGITPLSLTLSSPQDDGFLSYVVNGNTLKIGSRFAALRLFLMPIGTRELINTFGPDGKAYHEYTRYHRSGWVEAYIVPEDPGESMATYATLFKPDRRGPTRQDAADLVMDAISRWTARGIRVYGFRPPTCEAMLALESAQAQWDADEFIGRFEAAGGNWLTFDEDAYHTYDNSHLDSESAKRFSADLAAKIVADRSGAN